MKEEITMSRYDKDELKVIEFIEVIIDDLIKMGLVERRNIDGEPDYGLDEASKTAFLICRRVIKRGFMKIVIDSELKRVLRRFAREVADLIENGFSDEPLKWGEDGVRVQIGKILPKEELPKKTLTRCRKIFRKVLSEELEPKGWTQIRPNFFRRGQAEI
jgi:hypothetical protein